ncbi:MAG: hypothetical protein HY286_14730 [Planctomycetes bacterium]|nr:hypothetical protein [Planctomycetota bacterium]
MAEQNIEIRGFKPGDEQPLLECYHKVFGADPPGGARNAERWHWQFINNPTPGGKELILLAVDRDAPSTKVVGHFGGMPMKMFDRGAAKNAIIAVDEMVDPGYRRGLRRPGLFGNLGMEWFKRHQSSESYPLVYGFPNLAHFRIGNAVLRYEVIRTQPVLYREPLSPVAAGRGVEIVEINKAGEEFDRLFERLAPDLKLLVWRDHKYINWRFLEYRGFRYRVFAARDANGLRGYAVFRVCDWFIQNNCIIVDWLVPGGDIDATRELLRAGESLRAESGGPCISIMIPDNNPWFRDLQYEGFMVSPTDYICCCVSIGKQYSPYVLRREWYYTHGDFDHI